MAIQLTPEKKIGLFQMLATKDLYSVGLEYGFDKHYKTAKAVKGAVYRLYADMKNNPDKYAIPDELYSVVQDAMKGRQVSAVHKDSSLAEKMGEKTEIKDIILDNRNKAAKLVSLKLDMLSKSKKELSKISLPQLTTSMAILFDKGQIIQGEATEHIAHLAKIDEGMTPEELLNAVVGQREATIIAKNK